MTYDEDPTRWTSSPDEAPELLRGAFVAGRDEGPNRTQMRSLALKIAAASAGGAVAVGTVKAASAGQAIATAATWSAAKVAAVVAVAGALVTGGALVWQAHDARPQNTEERSARFGETAIAAPSEAAPVVGQRGSASASEPRPTVSAVPRGDAPVVENLAPNVATHESAHASGNDGSATRAATHVGTAARAVSPRVKQKASAGLTSRLQPQPQGGKTGPEAAQEKVKPTAPPSEIELLHRAQVALQGRPREAFQLTQEHRRYYPAGEFAQERDALAIQALMRAGETEKARDLAASFIRSYPSSPHAHRFREAMGLH
jgi:hypothetical protein